MIAAITAAYTRHYSDNGQTKTYVEHVDANGRAGRTEGDAWNPHMQALLARGQREGIACRKEVW